MTYHSLELGHVVTVVRYFLGLCSVSDLRKIGHSISHRDGTERR